MNVCIITSTFPTNEHDPLGGFIYDFSLKLAEYHTVTVFTQKRSDDYHLRDTINLITFSWKGNDIPLSDLKYYNIKHVLYAINLFVNALKALKKVIKSFKIDFSFSFWALPSGLASYYLLKKHAVPFAVWCLGSDIWKYKNNRIIRPILKKILVSSRTVYTDGYNFCKEVDQISSKTSRFLPSCRTIPKNIVNNKSGKTAKKTFLFIGRYHYNKGPDVLIRAIRILPEQIGANSDFVFYGTGPLKRFIIDQVNKSNLQNVFINDMIGTNGIFEVFLHSHFLIIPSRFDSIPVILSDALQCNTPILGADVGDVGDIIKKFKIGYVFKKGDPIELRECIIKAFKDDKKDFLTNLAEANKIFSVEYAVNEFLKNM